MQSQNLVKRGILVANSLLSASENKRNFRETVAAMLSPSYLKAPPYFLFESGEQWTVTVWLHWCQAHCIRQEFSPICLSLSQYYLAYFILAAETAVMVQAQTTQKNNNMLGNICLHTPRACASWKNSIHQLLTRYTACVKKWSSYPDFCLNLHPGLLWQSRLIWTGTSFTELSDAALKKVELPFSFLGSLSSFIVFYQSSAFLSLINVTQNFMKRNSTLHPSCFLSQEIHTCFELRKKIKHKTVDCFPVNTSTEQVKWWLNFHIKCDVNLSLYLEIFNQIWSGFYSSSWFCKLCYKFQRDYIANIFTGFAWANRPRCHNV